MKNRHQTLNTAEKPLIPSRLLLFAEWLGVLAMMLLHGGLKIRSVKKEKISAPCLILSNHASFVDFAVAAKALFPHRSYWVVSIEEFVGRERPLRSVGGIYKRKFTAELTLVKHLYTVLRQRKRLCVMYPEARYSLAGVNERLSDALGKLVKTMSCQVVLLLEHGNFICQPQWYGGAAHLTPVETERRVLITAEEAKSLPAELLQQRIEEAFSYDDYRWQAEKHIAVRSRRRAEGLHRILYQCAACGREFTTESRGTGLRCRACGAEWELGIYGQLSRTNGGERFTHIPDWYRWERENVNREVENGSYRFEDEVRIEHLKSGRRGFTKLGYGTLVQDGNGFTLEGVGTDGTPFSLKRSALSMESVHIEYDFNKRGVEERGPALDLCTLTDSYFVFPRTKGAALTKIHFATEALHDRAKAAE